MPRLKWSIFGYIRKWNFTKNRLHEKSHSNFSKETHDLIRIIEKLSKRKDWHNYTHIEYELQRIGTGEHGEAVTLPLEEESQERKIFLKNGYNGALSDKIALNRSLPDVRHPDCKKKQYLESLPTVSVVVPFYNEHLSTLLRTVYSVLNRSPGHLIKEIFLVDDASTKDFLNGTLEEYLKDHLSKIKLLRQTTRTGLVGARLIGAKAATADVLVIMDSNTEANVNWLPPLLEPIVLDNRVAAAPCIDGINPNTFKYQKTDDGGRAAFDWDLWYKRPFFLPNILKKLPEPFETPVIPGSVIAISRKFFWELGGFDPGIKIWGAEHLELSFKIWLCGGRLLEVPCSRVGHIGRMLAPFLIDHNYKDFLTKNNRRVAEVWMDEYAKYVYANNPEWRDIDPGDLTEQKALRKKLKCKPFKWFMTQVAYDLQQNFPAVIPAPYAEGQIRPVLNPKLCVDGNNGGTGQSFIISLCNGSSEQHFQLSWHQDIRMIREQKKIYGTRFFCWDVPEPRKHRATVQIFFCHHDGGNQEWKYNEKMQRIEHQSGNCLDYDKDTLELFLNQCVKMAKTQQWIFDTINKKQLAKWENRESRATQITGPVEKWEELNETNTIR